MADALSLREEDIFGRRVDATVDPLRPVVVMVIGATLTEILKDLAAGHSGDRADVRGKSAKAQDASRPAIRARLP
jgi:hypothetical protein